MKKFFKRIACEVSAEKNQLPITLVTSALMILLGYALHTMGVFTVHDKELVKVGFICCGDESTACSENFLRAADVLSMQLGTRVDMTVKTNVPEESTRKALDELMSEESDIIFADSIEYGDIMKEYASANPGVQFCQAGCSNANDGTVLDNYHTFMAEIYQGWYVSGRVAGSKLKQMIDNGEIGEDHALLGFVAVSGDEQSISNFTAFILGARRECESARLKVRYINSRSNYRLEKQTAEKLLRENCVIISQDTDTGGAAAACENSRLAHKVYHISYNQNMIIQAPNSTLTGTRIEWAPYICSAAQAVMSNKKIEKNIDGNIHGNDVGGGFSQGWVKMLDVNRAAAPKASMDIIGESIEEFDRSDQPVFCGNYFGIDPKNETDICDLNDAFKECRYRSAPSFHYILDDIVVIEE